jgi:hypothetical protein
MRVSGFRLCFAMALACLCLVPRVRAAEDYSTWAHSAKIHINTTAAGANVPRAIQQFALLVRITDARIFSQSMSTGADVRFAGSDGTHLDYQIERWAPAQGKAEIWVRVPQLDSASDKQYLNVYWGKPGSAWLSDANKVFTRMPSYWAVYHLGEGGAQARANSVGNWNHATPVNYDGDERVEGVIGMADSLDGQAKGGDYLDLGAGFDTLQNFTYTVWARPTKPGMWARLLDLGVGENNENFVFARANLSDSLATHAFGALTTTNTWGGRSMQTTVNIADFGSANGGPAFETGKWAFFGVSVSGRSVWLYRNGAPFAAGSFTHPLNVVHRIKNFIGHSNWAVDADFTGVMDEAQFSSAAHSPEWMKLSYESQRPGATMLTWEFPPEVKLSITTQPVGVSVDEGKPLKLGIVATASGSIAYQWMKDGTPIAGAVAADLSIAATTLADAGVYACRVTDGKDTLVSKSAAVSVSEDFSTWTYSKRIYFNTTATGADLAGEVRNIPILVRLGKKNFDFGQAGEGGKDLRFAASDGTVLAHYLERWTGDSAEAWVRANKVPANSDKDYLTMYWGKATARQASLPGYVFSLNDAWRVYYTLGDAPSGALGTTQAADATLNGLRGAGAGVAAVADGVIGKAYGFSGAATSHAEAPQAAVEGLKTFTVMAWAREKAVGHGPGVIDDPHLFGTRLAAAGQGEFGAYSHDGYLGFWSGMHAATPWASQATTFKLNDGAWHLIALTCSGSALTLYADGVSLGSLPGDNVALAPNVLSLGSLRSAQGVWGGAFTGDLDGVQVTGDAKGADWIKLAYAAQRPGATLLTFGAPADQPPAPPQIFPPAGDYEGPLQVQITSSADGARILYTLDGTAPDTVARGSTRTLSSSVLLSRDGTVKAIAYRNGKASAVAAAAYRITAAAGGDTLAPGGAKAVDSLRRVSYPNQDAKVPVLVSLGPAWNPEPSGFDRIGPLFRVVPADTASAFPGLALEGDSLAGLALFRRDPNGVILWMPPKDGQLWIPGPGSYFWARDVRAPRIRFVSATAHGGDSVAARVILEDNVALVHGKIRFNSGKTDSLGWWPSASGDTLEFVLPAPSDPAAPVEAEFLAMDASRETRFPGQGRRITLPRPIPSLSARLGLKEGYRWKMAGMPLACEAPVTLRELAERSGTGPVVAAVWRSHAAPDTGYKLLRDDDPLPAGKGFWLAASEGAPSLDFPPASAVASDTDGWFPIALERGWNLVTCPALKPLAWPVSVNDGEAYLHSALKPLFGFADTGYSRPDSLRPWEAYYVHYDKDTVVRVGPGAPRVSDRTATPKPSSAAGLRLGLSAAGGIRLSLGAAPAARAGLGVEDERQPPALDAASQAWISREGRALSVDYVKWDPSEAMSWTVAARAQPPGASLAVSSAALPEGYEAWAVSPARRLKWRLDPGGNVPVTGDDSLLIYAGTPAALAKIADLRRGRTAAGAFAAFLLPAPGGLQLVLDLPGDARIDARVLSARGEIVGGLSDRVLSPGRHVLGWPALATGGTPLPQGMYWVDLKAKGQSWSRRKVCSLGLVR